MLQFRNAESFLDHMFDLILEHGKVKGGRYPEDVTKYVRNVCISIGNPADNEINLPWRKWSKEYAELEWAWYLTGDRNPAMVEERAKLWSKMKDDEGKVWSNYGWWWKHGDQLNEMIKLLRESPNTRRAILTHYEAPLLPDQYKQDTPCNLILNFYFEDDKLCLTIFARSIDLIFGFCNDQYCFSKLMLHVRDGLPEGYEIGTMTYMITDLHVYKKDWERKLNKQTNGKNS